MGGILQLSHLFRLSPLSSETISVLNPAMFTAMLVLIKGELGVNEIFRRDKGCTFLPFLVLYIIHPPCKLRLFFTSFAFDTAYCVLLSLH